ncbi:MAG: DUF1906 domain-containing protein [Propionibacteriaceae bacterium]|jgi:peptidoglycan hydrolase-like protein with peptidoglycan-binding domain|nr:DUF1906 domain-containing protein [Propionibacteriaceae bacterium]
MDAWVQKTQQWLNATYAGRPGWGAPIMEDGITGWTVITRLIRGLQIELGIPSTQLADTFGPTTTSRFTSQIGRIDSSTPSGNVLKLLAGALWCKGYSGDWNGFDAQTSFANLANSVATVRNDLGLDFTTAYVDAKLMKSLLSMDAYTTTWTSGTSSIRAVQRWLNATYSPRRDFALIPCDGVHSRQILTAMLYALQYEFGMNDDTANGNFGPGTQSGLRAQAPVRQGDFDTSRHFIRLFQGALRLNGYDCPFDGTFNAATKQQTAAFQDLMELPATGDGDFGTWCALLVSTGDPDRAVTGLDTSTQLVSAQTKSAKAGGYTHVGRYIVGAGKFLRSEELTELKAAGLALFPIHQRFNNSDAQMTRDLGWAHGIEALVRCRTLGLPHKSTVFFTVDYDPVGESIDGPVAQYFKGVNAALDAHLCGTYDVGVYGTRNVCQKMLDAGLASTAFVSGMSWGFSGNMGFAMPTNWSYNQIAEKSESLGGIPTSIDRVAVSRRATAVDLTTTTPPPTDPDGTNPDTGFDLLYQWTVAAEATCERALKEAYSSLWPYSSYTFRIPDYILGWLRKPRFWADRNPTLWHLYTPELSLDPEDITARGICEAALDLMQSQSDNDSSLMNILTWPNPDFRKVPHLAVATLSQRMYPTVTTPTLYGLGEIGTWLFDLLGLWGQYQRRFTSQNYVAWALDMIGKIGGIDEDGHTDDAAYVANPGSAFSYADILADADSWLLMRAMDGDTSGLALSSAMRSVFQEDSNNRILRFYHDRFDANSASLAGAFVRTLDGLDVFATNIGATLPEVKKAAGLIGDDHSEFPLPTPEQAEKFANVYAAFLSNPHR